MYVHPIWNRCCAGAQKLSLGFLAVCWWVHAAPLARAIDHSWANPVSGGFGIPINWSPASVPRAADVAQFNLGSGGYTVTWPSHVAENLAALHVLNDNVVLDLNLGQMLISDSAVNPVIIGTAATASSLTVRNGYVQAAGTSLIGHDAGTIGAVTIEGQSYWYSSAGGFDVGHAGTGALSTSALPGAQSPPMISLQTLTAGIDSTGIGTVNFAGGGTANVYSSATIGGSGTGSLNVSGGTNVWLKSVQLADQPGSHGSLTVSGKLSQLSTEVSAGQGVANITVSAGGTMSLGKTTGPVSITVQDAGTQWLDSIYLADNGLATVVIKAGGAVAAQYAMEIESNPTGTANVTVKDAGSTWNGDNGMYLGDHGGSANFRVENGATARVTGETRVGGTGVGGASSLTVTGAGSMFTGNTLNVYGLSTLSVADGGSLNAATSLQIAPDSTVNTPSLAVSGAATQLTSSLLKMGGAHVSATIATGAQVGITNTTLAGNADSLQLSDPGTHWQGNTIVGTNSTAVDLAISNGATMTLAAQFTTAAVATSHVTITGQGSQFTAQTLNLANTQVKLSDGGVLTAASVNAANSVIDVSGGGVFTVGAVADALTATTATATAITPGTVQIDPTGTFTGLSKIIGSVINAGTLYPKDQVSPYTLSITGDYTQLAGGKLKLDAAGAPYNASHHLVVSGNASLAGEIDVNFLVPPALGNVFRLVSAGGTLSHSGLSFSVTGLRSGLGYSTSFNGGDLYMTVVPEPSGYGLAAAGIVSLCFYCRRRAG